MSVSRSRSTRARGLLAAAKDLIKKGLGSIHYRLDASRRHSDARRLTAAGKLSYGVGTYGTPIVYDIEGDYQSKVIIGKFCSIANGVRILLGGEHRVDWVTTFPFRFIYGLEGNYTDGQPFSRGDVVIQNDVWIGSDVFIRSGVTVGNGAVIGARSVITRDIEPYEVVIGNPCRRLRLRFTERQIEQLLQIRWWDWPIETILRHVPLLCSDDIDQFIAESLKSGQ